MYIENENNYHTRSSDKDLLVWDNYSYFYRTNRNQ